MKTKILKFFIVPIFILFCENALSASKIYWEDGFKIIHAMFNLYEKDFKNTEFFVINIKNPYFKDFNVIQISAEGFSGYALETDLFPTLSMMAEEGFVFDNYYSLFLHLI
mgnify:CR=1 FL=1